MSLNSDDPDATPCLCDAVVLRRQDFVPTGHRLSKQQIPTGVLVYYYLETRQNNSDFRASIFCNFAQEAASILGSLSTTYRLLHCKEPTIEWRIDLYAFHPLTFHYLIYMDRFSHFCSELLAFSSFLKQVQPRRTGE